MASLMSRIKCGIKQARILLYMLYTMVMLQDILKS